MKILITGGCGFVGSNLAQDAIYKGQEVLVFDNLSRIGAAENLEWLKSVGKFEFRHGDIRSADDVNNIFKYFKPDAIFHLAGQVAMTTSISSPRTDFEINVLGTFNLLEAVRTSVPNAAIIYSSTNKVYGGLKQYEYVESSTRYECVDKPHGFDEKTPLEFHSPYGCSKGAADQYILDYSRIFGLRTVVFRHSSMYGGRQFSTVDQGWVAWFCQKAIDLQHQEKGSTITVSGNGKQVRDVLHVADVLLLYQNTLKYIDVCNGLPFNIGGGFENSLSLIDLLLILETKLNIKIEIKQLPARQSDQLVFIADIALAEERINWKPGIGFNKGIDMTLEWLQSSST